MFKAELHCNLAAARWLSRNKKFFSYGDIERARVSKSGFLGSNVSHDGRFLEIARWDGSKYHPDDAGPVEVSYYLTN